MSTDTTAELARTAELGGQRVTLERPNGVKASRALAELKQAGSAVKEVTTAMGEFITEYERTHVIELDRIQARMRYPGRPILGLDGEVALEPAERPDGSPNPRAGQPAMAPSLVDAMTEEDWREAGGRLRLPESPSQQEVIGAVLPVALEHGEERIWRLLALFLIPNAEVARARRDGRLDALLEERVSTLLEDAYADELMELAAAVGEVIDHHFRRKASEVGERMGNALRVIGLGKKKPTTPTPAPTPSSSSSPQEESPTSTSTPAEEDATDATSSPSSSRPTSSTASDAPTDGPPTPSSSSPMTSSPPSASASATSKSD